MKRSLRRLLPFWERFAGFSRGSFLCRHFGLVNSFAQFAKFVKFGNLDKIRLSLIEDDSQRASTNILAAVRLAPYPRNGVSTGKAVAQDFTRTRETPAIYAQNHVHR